MTSDMEELISLMYTELTVMIRDSLPKDIGARYPLAKRVDDINYLVRFTLERYQLVVDKHYPGQLLVAYPACENCERFEDQHPGGQCLFQATHFKPHPSLIYEVTDGTLRMKIGLRNKE